MWYSTWPLSVLRRPLRWYGVANNAKSCLLSGRVKPRTGATLRPADLDRDADLGVVPAEWYRGRMAPQNGWPPPGKTAGTLRRGVVGSIPTCVRTLIKYGRLCV